jgi:2-succinyl-5-enolpyruvyl-6-hydroxy-3-cyclohexene-1-carboxylate synthase
MTAQIRGAVQAAFAATLVDEWVRAGVRHAVVSPGSRSAPLAVALAAAEGLAVHVVLDERSAGFMALGVGKAGGVPAVVVTTSGTAGVELHPAVVEAHQARVPLLVCTANRPPELHGVGAPQTVEQTHLYGSSVRWFAQPGVADAVSSSTWRSLGARSVAETLGPPPGPVHLDLAFRDPLVAPPAALPEGREGGRPWHAVLAAPAAPAHRDVEAAAGLLGAGRGVIVAGAGIGPGDVEAVGALAAAWGWPVLADPPSGSRTPGQLTVAAFDALLRHEAFACDHRPEAVLRLGAAPASKVLSQWLAGSGARQVLVDPDDAWIDPERTATMVARGDPGAWCRALVAQARAAPGRRPADPSWLTSWAAAEASAQHAIDTVLGRQLEANEPGVARTLAGALAPGATLVVSSSMPVRDLEWYARPRAELRVLANRGANGIDGVVSTAVGVALASRGPTALLIGDLAFLHDANGLLGLAGRGVDLAIVVVDNGGGGIFSFLPPATALAADRFEMLFGTPHDVDLVALARLHGVAATAAGNAAELAPALQEAMASGGVRVVVVRTDRAANVALHREIHAEVAAALSAK